MRIVLLPSAYAPFVGGVEVLTNRLAVNLEEAGHRVEVWTARSSRDHLAAQEMVDGIQVRRFVFATPRASLVAASAWPLQAGSTVAEMLRAIRTFRPEVLHVQCYGANGVFATLVSALARVPLVVTLQGETFMDDHDIYDRSAFFRTGLRAGLRRARVVTGCSKFTIDDSIRRFGLEPEKARVVFNGVDSEDGVSQSTPLPFERYVLGLGRFVRRKGFDLVIDAWAGVADRHGDVGLVLAGTGPEREVLLGHAKARGVADRVHIVGPFGRGEVASLMERAEVFVMPSRVEAFGIVVLEAWRAGTPAIVTTHGGTKEFVEDGVSALVVNPHDTSALADAVHLLLSDEDLRGRLASNAKGRLDDFKWSRIRAQYEDVYAFAVGRGAGV
jgi:glycogen synthase